MGLFLAIMLDFEVILKHFFDREAEAEAQNTTSQEAEAHAEARKKCFWKRKRMRRRDLRFFQNPGIR